MVAADFSCKKSHNLKPNLLLIASKGVFNLHKLSDSHPDYQTKFKVDNTIQAHYNDLCNLVKRQMMDNKYGIVSLNKVFEGFFPRAPMTAAN